MVDTCMHWALFKPGSPCLPPQMLSFLYAESFPVFPLQVIEQYRTMLLFMAPTLDPQLLA